MAQCPSICFLCCLRLHSLQDAVRERQRRRFPLAVLFPVRRSFHRHQNKTTTSAGPREQTQETRDKEEMLKARGSVKCSPNKSQKRTGKTARNLLADRLLHL